MPAARLIRLGLDGLARAHRFDYFLDGHRAASMVAAHLLGVENGLDRAATGRIGALFDRNWATDPLCAPFPDGAPAPERIAEIGAALAEGGATLREVGHNAIFAMLALKGFRLCPELATPARIDGVVALIRAIKPWRDVDPDPAVDPPPFADAAGFVLREALAAVERWQGWGQGFSGHLLTFGQALVELAAMGHPDWAESCRPAFRKYVTLTRRGPTAESKPYAEHAPTARRPVHTAYWAARGDDTLGIGHVFKYPYSYYNLHRRAADPVLRDVWEAQAWRVF